MQGRHGHTSLAGPRLACGSAGNCVVLKPSEVSSSIEKVLAEVLPRYLDQVSLLGPHGEGTGGVLQARQPGMDRYWLLTPCCLVHGDLGLAP